VKSFWKYQAAIIVTTNLSFSEWTTMFPNAQLCKAKLDRLTDQATLLTPAASLIGFDERWKERREVRDDAARMVSG
jgi:DNA replication protein DnaC